MSFTLSDIIIENSIRTVLQQFRTAAQMTDKTIIGALVDNLFDFTATGQEVRAIGPDGSRLPAEREGGIGTAVGNKYLQERARLISFFETNEIAIVHSFNDVQVHLPCVSIQLAADGEDQGLALTDDFGGIGGLDVATMTNASIGQDVNTIHANAVVNVGIHTKEQLVTKYLYHVVKYAILSNKEELIRQNFIIATFKGSDFSRDAGWSGDHVYTRFLNISGKTEDSWVNIDEIVVEGETVDLSLLLSRETDDPMVMSNSTFTPASPAITDIPVNVDGNTAMIQVANSSYLPSSGTVQLVSRNGFGVQIDALAITLTGNNVNTNILSTTTGIPNAFTIVRSENRVDARYVEVLAGNTVMLIATIQTLPDTVTTSRDKQNIADAEGVTHRDNIATRPTV